MLIRDKDWLILASIIQLIYNVLYFIYEFTVQSEKLFLLVSLLLYWN